MNRESFEQALQDVEDGMKILKTKEAKEAFVIQYITAHAPKDNRIWTSRQLWLLFGKTEE